MHSTSFNYQGESQVKQAAFSFLLVLVLEAISAVVEYLKKKLYHHLNRDNPFGSDFEPEYG